MFGKVNLQIVFPVLIIFVLIITACQAPPTSPEPVADNLEVTEVVEATPVETIQVATPFPEPAESRTLTICMREDPTTGSFRYVKGDLNFSNSWAKRDKIKYDYYHNVFN